MKWSGWIEKAMAYLGMPLLFALIGYIILYAAASPVLVPVHNLISLMSMDDKMSLQDDSSYDDLFADQSAPAAASGDTVGASTITFPSFGARYGNLSIEGRSVDAPLFFGDSNAELKRGVGQFNGSSYPGCGGTVLIGGHNNSYFNGLKNVETGDIITLETNYGTYKYRVTKTVVLPESDTNAYDLNAGKENLVLYTCYPFDMLGLTPNRYFVYADFESGPRVLLNK